MKKFSPDPFSHGIRKLLICQARGHKKHNQHKIRSVFMKRMRILMPKQRYVSPLPQILNS